MMTDWQSEVGGWWAERLGLPPAALRSGGIYLVPGSDHVGVLAVTGAARPLGYGPARALPALRRVISGFSRSAVRQRTTSGRPGRWRPWRPG